jgi:hypothetical protein
MKIKYKSDRPFIPSPVLVIMQEYGVGFNSLKGKKVENGVYESEIILPQEEQKRIEFLRACKTLETFVSATI